MLSLNLISTADMDGSESAVGSQYHSPGCYPPSRKSAETIKFTQMVYDITAGNKYVHFYIHASSDVERSMMDDFKTVNKYGVHANLIYEGWRVEIQNAVQST